MTLADGRPVWGAVAEPRDANWRKDFDGVDGHTTSHCNNGTRS